MKDQKEYIVAVACSLCHGTQLSEDMNVNKELIRRVLASGHESIVEHATYTFLIKNVSRALTHQLVRHRIASYTQSSQRYIPSVTQDENGIVRHNYINPFEEGTEEYSMTEDIFSDIAITYLDLLSLGVKFEDARVITPNADTTHIVMTINARSLFNFFKARCCTRAQTEIRKLAYRMLELVKEDTPVIFEKAGPECINGVCYEAVPCKSNVKKMER